MDADTVTIDQGIGQVDARGMVNVKPEADITYTLTAGNKVGTTIASVKVLVDAPDALPVIKVFMCEPSTIKQGKQSTVSWEVADAHYVRISGVGSVRDVGKCRYIPAQRSFIH
jgi:hypothetical protein